MTQGVHGKHINLYTGMGIGRNCYIYDDSVPGNAISVNGRHQDLSWE